MASVARLIDSQLQWDTASCIHWLKKLAFTSSEVPPEGRLAGANQMLDELNSAAAAADAAAAGKAAERQRREATAQATAQARVATKATEDARKAEVAAAKVARVATKATEDARKAEVAAAKVRKLEDKARETEARKATRAARDEAAAAAEPAPGRVKEYRRINLFGGPLGVDETEDSGPTTMPRSVKVSLCKKAIALLYRTVMALIAAWVQAGSDLDNPPLITNGSGGSELGGKTAKVHLQLTFEYWDLAHLADDTVRSHLKAWAQPLLDALVDKEKGESWPLKAKMIPPGLPVEAKSGWFYQNAYTHKDSPYDHCATFRAGVEALVAAALGVYHLETIWSRCVAVFAKAEMDPKGTAGKRAWSNLAAMVRGRTHAAVEIFEKNDIARATLKFNSIHDMVWLDLDATTTAMLMLSCGAYGLGTTWISSSLGGLVDVVQIDCFIRIMTNGFLASCFPILNMAMYRKFNDDAAVRLHERGRSATLPPISVIRRMTLDEVKALGTNGMRLPRRLMHVTDYTLNPSAPQAAVVDLGSLLVDMQVSVGRSCYDALDMLGTAGANINPLIMPGFTTKGGDEDGSFIAATIDVLLRCAGSGGGGLLSVHESDIYQVFTDSTKRLADIICAADEPADAAGRVRLLLDRHLAARPLPSGLAYELFYVESLDDVSAQYEAHAAALTNTIFVYVVGVEVSVHGGMGMAPPAPERAATPQFAPLAPNAMPMPYRGAGGGDDDANLDLGLNNAHDLDNSDAASDDEWAHEGEEADASAAAATARVDARIAATGLAIGGVGFSPTPSDAGPPPERPAPSLPPPPTAVEQPSRIVPHHYIVAFWPGHEQHVPTDTHTSLGELEEASEELWTAVRAAPSIDAARTLLLDLAPMEYFLRGEAILRNKSAQLCAQRIMTLEPKWTLDDFTKGKLPNFGVQSILLPGDAGIGKTCLAMAHGRRPYVMKTIDQLKDVPADCDVLVFDDMRFDKQGLDITPEEMIALLDCKMQTAIKCRHYDGIIPCLPRIFTTNLDCKGAQHPFPPGASRAQCDAIARRHIQMSWQSKWMFKVQQRPDTEAKEAAALW